MDSAVLMIEMKYRGHKPVPTRDRVFVGKLTYGGGRKKNKKKHQSVMDKVRIAHSRELFRRKKEVGRVVVHIVFLSCVTVACWL